MNLFQLGDFTLNSGARSSFKLECDALTDADWECLAQMIAAVVGPFDTVEGVPTGGLKLAAALNKYRECIRFPTIMKFVPDAHLIVDDVLTTGGSMTRLYMNCTGDAGMTATGAIVKGAVVFARGPCPTWITPLFQMPPSLFLSGDPRGPQTPLSK